MCVGEYTHVCIYVHLGKSVCEQAIHTLSLADLFQYAIMRRCFPFLPMSLLRFAIVTPLTNLISLARYLHLSILSYASEHRDRVLGELPGIAAIRPRASSASYLPSVSTKGFSFRVETEAQHSCLFSSRSSINITQTIYNLSVLTRTFKM